MPTQPYFAADGVRVPSVTTILGRWKESGGLIRWAYQMGRNGKDMDEAKNTAAEAGTIAHAWVDDFVLYGQEPEPDGSELHVKASSAYSAFRAWWDMSKVEIISTEKPLVSEKYRYGGTYDAIGKINGVMCVIDWKTSNSVYAEYLIQIAAYKNLWEETGGEPINGFHLCRFAKEHGDFSHHYYPNLDEAWRQFVLFREAYDIDKQLKKRAA